MTRRRKPEITSAQAAAVWAEYPTDWPPCPGCGLPALDGRASCGDARCGGPAYDEQGFALEDADTESGAVCS